MSTQQMAGRLCVNCGNFKEKGSFGKCTLFVWKDLIRGQDDYSDTNFVRYDEDKCGVNGKLWVRK